MYRRPGYKLLQQRLSEKRHFIQVINGPRQVGKTTLIQQVLQELPIPHHYTTAEDRGLHNVAWLETQWEIARSKCAGTEALLVLDEIQKIPDWSTTIKKLWDEDTRLKTPLKVVLLGSSPLLVQKGLEESMTGRFEIIPLTHWTFAEMQEAFNFNLSQFIYFGGYPGAAALISDEARWSRYIIDSIVETTISRDILLLNPIYKPALLRQLFHTGCQYSSQILSLQKILGQLHDAGNTTTLSHYLHLLFGAGMLTGLQKYAKGIVRQRASSPKFQILNTALFSALSDTDYQSAQLNREFWGRLVESALGAYLINYSLGTKWKVFYWREKNLEVDFVLQYGKDIVAIEVKSGINKTTVPGLEKFRQLYKNAKLLLVGSNGIDIGDFLTTPLEKWL